MQQEDKIRELQIFAQQIRVETIRALATLGLAIREALCRLQRHWLCCTAAS